MYNTPVRFDGDIIITDPCYIIRKGEDQLVKTIKFKTVEEPYMENYLTHKNKTEYDDCIMINIEDPRVDADLKRMRKDMIQRFTREGVNSETEKRIVAKLSVVPYSERYNKEWESYYNALLEYSQTHYHDDWSYCECGESMERLGLKTFLCESTIYGDWSCTTFNSDTKKKIGNFCADAGMVAVFLLDEVLKYNPNFDYHIERPWTTTLIKDFHGTVELEMKDDEVRVVGKGNVNFVGTQTGF